MASTPSNTFRFNTYDGRLAGIPIVPGQAINQGDLLMWDTSLNSGNGGARVPAAQADMNAAGGGYFGVSDNTDPVASLGDYLNNVNAIIGGVCVFKTTAGDTYKMFTKVFFNETVDAQTITSNTNAGARTIPVGYAIIKPELVMAGTLTLAGAAGVNILVSLTPFFIPAPK